MAHSFIELTKPLHHKAMIHDVLGYSQLTVL